MHEKILSWGEPVQPGFFDLEDCYREPGRNIDASFVHVPAQRNRREENAAIPEDAYLHLNLQGRQ